MALKPGGHALMIREQIIEDHEMTLWVRESSSGFTLTVLSPHLEFGNRDFAFTEDGENYAVGSCVTVVCRPTWISEVP